MSKLLLGVVLLLLATKFAASADNSVCTPYMPLVIQISSLFADGTRNDGFGFIVGEKNSHFYIATAGHVVRRPADPDQLADVAKEVRLRFFWDPGVETKDAVLLDIQPKAGLDLALLRIDKSKVFGAADEVSWPGRSWCSHWQNEEPVWFVGRERQWYVPVSKSPGYLRGSQADGRGFVQVENLSMVQPGTSGAPLIARCGIVGMVVRDDVAKVQAVAVEQIRRFVAEENPYPWNLDECQEIASSNDSVQFEVAMPLPLRLPFVARPLDAEKPVLTNAERKLSEAALENAGPQSVALSERAEKEAEAFVPATEPVASSIRGRVPEPSVDGQDNAIKEQLQEASGSEQEASGPVDLMRDEAVGIELVWVPGGCFQMGSASKDKDHVDDEGPIHEVCVDGMWMGRYEVTQGLWQKVMGTSPAGLPKGSNQPMEGVSWEDAQQFIGKLNALSGRTYRLPTEAEWEHACRAGSNATHCGGDDPDAVAWHEGNSGGIAHSVGSKQANGFGLHDMSGNVWEWCADWYSKDSYKETGSNLQRTAAGTQRTMRGGSYLRSPLHCRSAYRNSGPPKIRSSGIGLRLVLPPRTTGGLSPTSASN